MRPSGSRSRWHIPLCLERPQYTQYMLAGANYRLVQTSPIAVELNRAAWSQDAYEALAAGTCKSFPATSEEKTRWERRGRNSDSSETSFYSGSEVEDGDSDGENREAAVLHMTPEGITQEEDGLEEDFVASCAAKQQGEQWEAEVRIPVPLFRRLNRKGTSKGALWRTLELLGAEAGHFQIPRGRTGDVVLPLRCCTQRRVCLAVRKVQQLVASKRSSLPVTHFVSLPLATPELQARFEVYKHLMLASKYPGIDESFFISKHKLHITLLVLRLLTPAEIKAAEAAVKAAAADLYDAVGTRTLLLHLKGNSCFSDDPSAVSVIFAPLYSSESAEALEATKRMLNNMARLLAERLQAAGLLSREELEEQHALGPEGEFDCTFHMTLLKTLYKRTAKELPLQQEQEQQSHLAARKQPRRAVFDATQLLQDMRGFDFGVVRVPAVQLNSVSTQDQNTYHCLAQVDLP
ncbi:KH domain-containing protein, putative [Eimeria tenella]|uniref:KH domain-containing protein, putative n=1 Tax=Eimeria tenella TaxID=5802 RepID=H9B981_EIMTE|nr:KH domain-containing protein, putative [Eimeria tenella]AET50541.1 hypothetical protein [Eimeria tenella]CDJ37719.1 KH domain-containing protein, putative [Eimeria tenella]|eukprot:XP_013228557.1 KH domain-containing protein, putative [Eimeria tenella]